ncbi:MAG: oligosaccharide flippase family protein [Bacteroidaceae bacterium]|nr:oligosaccharide flippase family protein [Bacteroidaceae bacterium]
MSSIPQTNNKTIAKNTFFLYLRMLLYIGVSLYSSRVVLNTLGVEDYGLYGIVGGVVMMFNFLNSTMSGATSRFITYALGKNDEDDVSATFSSAIIVQLGIALVVFCLSETIGLWFLEYKLVIPEGRMMAARIVYQLSILAMLVRITQVPYNASIIAYEKMDVYAYVELLDVFLKLGIVYLLLIGNFDKLIMYAVLVVVVNVIITLIYRFYCHRKFTTCRFHWTINRKKVIPMLSFSGWDLFGNMSSTLNHQGINVLINMFFGVVYNAASSVATSVKGILETLSANVIQAFRPQIVKNYASGHYERMESLMYNGLKFSLLLFILFMVPMTFEVQKILELWLGIVPDFAAVFCRLMLIASLFNLINKILTISISATGYMKRISLITGSIYLLALPVIYVVFKLFDVSPSAAYIVVIGSMGIVVLSNVIILKKQVPQLNPFHYLKGVVEPVIVLMVSVLPVIPILVLMESSFVRVVLVFGIFGMTLALLTYFFCINQAMRVKVNQQIVSYFRRLQRKKK